MHGAAIGRMICQPTVERRRSVRFLAARTETSYWRTRPVPSWVVAVMTGPGRLSGRGAAVAAVPAPTVARLSRLILPFRLTSVVAAQMFDYGTFTVMIDRRGIAAEMNPIIVTGFLAFGLPVLALMKVALIVIIASIVFLLARERPLRRSVPGLAASITILAVFGGLFGGITNFLAT